MTTACLATFSRDDYGPYVPTIYVNGTDVIATWPWAQGSTMVDDCPAIHVAVSKLWRVGGGAGVPTLKIEVETTDAANPNDGHEEALIAPITFAPAERIYKSGADAPVDIYITRGSFLRKLGQHVRFRTTTQGYGDGEAMYEAWLLK
jgi:hypothetical protein